MTSRHWGGLLLWGWLGLAGAQELAPSPAALDADAERQRIGQERAAQEAIFLQAEGVCYSRFAVSDCLREARKIRRLALDDLRRQELVLNDMERKTRALAALKRIEAKLADQPQAPKPALSPETPR